MSKDKNELVKAAPAGVATVNEIPEYLREFQDLGNENVTRNDMTVPRLAVLQALSPECTPGDQKFIEDARPGMILNTLTGEIMKEVKVVNCYFVMEYAVFKRRTEGGGFRGVFHTKEEAVSFVNGHEECDKLEIIEQAVHYCLLLNGENQVASEAAVVMQSTKLKASRQWNGLIEMAKGPRFAGIWKLGTVPEKNAKGSYFNFKVGGPLGYTPVSIVPAAVGLYKAVSSGAKSVDREQEVETTTGATDDVRY